MGSAGSAWIKPKAASARGLRGEAHGKPPHPVAIRRGQRFFELTGSSRRTLRIDRVDGDHARCRIEDRNIGEPAGRMTRVPLARLLSTTAEGAGRLYRQLPWHPGRYATVAMLAVLEDRRCELRVPEWHPQRPVPFFARLIPADSRHIGAWVGITADLSAASGARLLVDLTGPADAELVDAAERLTQRSVGHPHQSQSTARPLPLLLP